MKNLRNKYIEAIATADDENALEMADQLIKDEFFNNKIQASITADLHPDQINQLKSDISFSSATIEHVGCRNNQIKMVENMINLGVNSFIEIGPGKVLSGLIKRINREVKVQSINNEADIKNLSI